jgi:hypothetical protein
MLEADALGPRSTIIVRSGHQPRYSTKRSARLPDLRPPATTDADTPELGASAFPFPRSVHSRIVHRSPCSVASISPRPGPVTA